MEIAGAIRRFILHKSRLRNEFRLVAGEIRIQTEKKIIIAETTRQTHKPFSKYRQFLFTSTKAKASSTGLKNEDLFQSIFPPGL